jgi:hypothetical protein
VFSKRNHVSSYEPVVNAWVGEIPRETEKGIEFTTAVKPDSYHPALVEWSIRESLASYFPVGSVIMDGYNLFWLTAVYPNGSRFLTFIGKGMSI